MPTPAPQVIHHAKFDDLTLGDPQLQRELLAAFVRQTPELRADLARGCVRGEPEFGEVVHRLKGSCHFIAAERLGAVAAAIEEAGTGRQPLGRRQGAVDLLLQELGLVEAQVAQTLAQLGSPDSAAA